MPNAVQDDDRCCVNQWTSLQLSNGTLGVWISTSAQKPAKRGCCHWNVVRMVEKVEIACQSRTFLLVMVMCLVSP